MNGRCEYCRMPVVGGDGKHFPRRKPLNSGESIFLGGSALMHTDCHREHWHNNVVGAIELDKPMNDCRFFVRDGKSEYGRYVRCGVSSPMRVWQSIDDGHVRTGGTGGEWLAFRAWLLTNGWLENWFEPRRPLEYNDHVLNARRCEQ